VTAAPWLRYALVAALALLAGILFQRDRGKTAAARTEIVRLTHEKRVVDTLIAHDTLIFTRTLKVEVAAHDTVLKHLSDTVYVLRYIAAADSTIKACTLVVSDCARRAAIDDSIIAAMKRARPSWLNEHVAVGPGVACVVGAGGRVSCGIGAMASVKVWP
jgi:hypothetical protein